MKFLAFRQQKLIIEGSIQLQKPIYVQTTIQTPMNEIWDYTQNPNLHTEWDLRFTEINYLKREENEPQRFLYKTKIGFGFEIAGTGESSGTIMKETGERVSSLKFETNNAISLIMKGRGYWKYTPKGDTVIFETQYDYETRYSKVGKLIDSTIFRPLMGRATAWSFDSLKIWLEKGYHPKLLLQKTLTYWSVCFLLAFIWIYQGLVPKMINTHPEEVKMLLTLIKIPMDGELAIRYIGLAEVLFGIVWLLPFQKRGLFLIHILMILSLTLSAWLANPQSFIMPFNPITLNLALMFLSIIGYLNSSNLPLARNCKRSKRGTMN